jgi:hypothetical protein
MQIMEVALFLPLINNLNWLEPFEKQHHSFATEDQIHIKHLAIINIKIINHTVCSKCQ